MVPMLRCGLSRMYCCLVMAEWLLVPPGGLADPDAFHGGTRELAPFPAGSRARTGKGQGRAPPNADRADEADRSAGAAVSAAPVSAEARTANRNMEPGCGRATVARNGFS